MVGNVLRGQLFKVVFSSRRNVVFSSIDLWKGCIAVVPPEFDRALVTVEFPIYEIWNLASLRISCPPCFGAAIIKGPFGLLPPGHSNRRRTQSDDFETLEVAFPTEPEEQSRLIQVILASREDIRSSIESLRSATLRFDDVIDGRGDEQLPEILSDSIHQLQLGLISLPNSRITHAISGNRERTHLLQRAPKVDDHHVCLSSLE